MIAPSTSLIFNKRQNRSRHRSRSRAVFASPLLPIMLMLVLAPKTLTSIVEGWSQSNSVVRRSTRQNALSVSRFTSRKPSPVQLQNKPPSEDNLSFFEDPSQIMQSSQSNSTAIASENNRLRDSIRMLEEENERLKRYVEKQHQKELEASTTNKRIVLETFEGEGLFDGVDGEQSFALAKTNDEDGDELWCDVLDGDECPIEPAVSFGEALRDRAYWLVGLLIMQSLSGIILSRNEMLLANHPVIIYYLTMMVGAGGNAGNQASVRVIRGIALGTLNERTRGQFLVRELKMAATLSLILSVAGFARTILFKTPLPEAITVTTALSLIVFTSVCLGAILPLLLERIGVDPAHSSTTIQVVMDILGVLLAVLVSGAILDGPLGAYLLPKLGF
mmetsp:Transcript_20615/g.51254  ORF Transcript_20615/g.51254 Transcript_20615/m.51254 type:complete len:390 (+) Transcript_20615:289-1458(+)